jgi:hypothetical protein
MPIQALDGGCKNTSGMIHPFKIEMAMVTGSTEENRHRKKRKDRKR